MSVMAIEGHTGLLRHEETGFLHASAATRSHVNLVYLTGKYELISTSIIRCMRICIKQPQNISCKHSLFKEILENIHVGSIDGRLSEAGAC